MHFGAQNSGPVKWRVGGGVHFGVPFEKKRVLLNDGCHVCFLFTSTTLEEA